MGGHPARRYPMRYSILILLLILTSIPQAHSGDVRMWRDADGKLHFGDAPTYQSDRVVTTPSYSGGSGSSGDIVERAERAERKRREQENYNYNQPNARGLSYDDDIRLRELRMEKGRLNDQMRRNKDRISVGEGWAISEDIRGINDQIRDIERRR